MTPFLGIVETNKMDDGNDCRTKAGLIDMSRFRRYRAASLFAISLFVGLGGAEVCQAAVRVVTGEAKNADTRERVIDAARNRDRRVDINAGREKARRLIRDDRYKEALIILEELYQKYPESNITVKLLADAYIRTGRAQEAVVLLEKKLKEDALDFEFIRSLGQAYLEMGQGEKAEKAWRRILAGENRQIPYYDNVAVLLWDAGQYENAISVLREGAVGGYFRTRMRKIINWERILGKTEDAFIDELKWLFSEEKRRDLRSAETILEIFRESGNDSSFLLLFDAAAGRKKEKEFLNLVKALLLVETDKYIRAWELVSGKESNLPEEILYYSFISAAAEMKHKAGREDCEEFMLKSTRRFLEKYSKSRLVPEVVLWKAELKFLQAKREWPHNNKKLKEAFRAAAGVTDHWAALPYYDRVRLLMARIQLEGMWRPEKALDILDSSKWRRKGIKSRVKIMRARALSISDRGDEAEKELKALASDTDSTVASEAAFRLSEFYFYSGRHSMALTGFSKLAEEYSSNNPANDALELAMLIKRGIENEESALDLVASARFLASRGKIAGAIDSLRMLEERFPESPLLPRAFLRRASFEIEAGMNNAAEADLRKIPEMYPMSVCATLALERLGDFVSLNRPEEALKQYRILIERYPDNPFISRVRKKYANLNKELGSNSRREAGEN